MTNQLSIYGKTRGLPELASLLRRSWVCWVMDIIYLANSENTYYINLFNLTIALVYLIEKSPPIREIKALSNDRGTRGQVAFPFGASTSFNSSRAEGKSGYPGGQ